MYDKYEMKTYTITLEVKVYEGYQEHPTHWQWDNLIDGMPPVGYTEREYIKLKSCKSKDNS